MPGTRPSNAPPAVASNSGSLALVKPTVYPASRNTSSSYSTGGAYRPDWGWRVAARDLPPVGAISISRPMGRAGAFSSSLSEGSSAVRRARIPSSIVRAPLLGGSSSF